MTKRNLFIDLGAEKIIGAEREGFLIAIEVKNFLSFSLITDFYDALGKYQLYFLALKRKFPERKLYLAIPHESYVSLISDPLLEEFIEELNLSLLIFNPKQEIIVEWIN